MEKTRQVTMRRVSTLVRAYAKVRIVPAEGVSALDAPSFRKRVLPGFPAPLALFRRREPDVRIDQWFRHDAPLGKTLCLTIRKWSILREHLHRLAAEFLGREQRVMHSAG